MQYNLDIRDNAIFDSAALTYKYRKTINTLYYALVASFKSVFCWQNLLLAWLGIVSIQLLFIAAMLIKIYS